MNFLASLFACGRAEQPTRSDNCLSVFCAAGNHKKMACSERCKNKEDSITVKTMSNSSRPASIMYDMTAKKTPTLNFLVLRGCFNRNEKQINWGFLVGMVGCLPCHQKLLPPSAMRVRIGRNEELRCLHSLRSNAFDKLLAIWSELGEEFSLGELIRCRQPLVLVVEEWALLQQLVRMYEEELLKALGEFCLQESGGKIFFNIINFQNKYALQFEESSFFKEHTKDFLERTLSITLSQQDFNLLMDRMTLNDYVQIRKDPLLMDRKIKHYMMEIQREKAERERAALFNDLQETVTRYHSEKMSKFSEEEILGVRKQSKSSDVELEAEYFAKHRKAGAEASLQSNPPEEGLLIYYFNNSEDVPEEPDTHLPPRPINLVRKIRSKSEDATYVPDEVLELDDEFYQKYQ